MLGGDKAGKLFGSAYREIVSLPSALAAYWWMFTEILDDERRPALFHCTTGKDRTGRAAAATLTLLGVSEKDVLADFLITNRDLLPALKPYFDRFASADPGSRLVRRNHPARMMRRPEGIDDRGCAPPTVRVAAGGT